MTSRGAAALPGMCGSEQTRTSFARNLWIEGENDLHASQAIGRVMEAVVSSRRKCRTRLLAIVLFDWACVGEPFKRKEDDMSKLLIALFVAAGLGFAGPVVAQGYSSKITPMSKEGYAAAKKDADVHYKADNDACSSLSGNAKDICVAEAKGKESIAKADAEAAYRNTPKARESARVAMATANYNVAHEKCDDLTGNAKDVCVKEAKAALVKGKANAKVDRVTADTRQEAATKQADVRKEASADKRDAEYKVAVEKCDALSGTAKDACVSSAKTQYGKS